MPPRSSRVFTLLIFLGAVLVGGILNLNGLDLVPAFGLALLGGVFVWVMTVPIFNALRANRRTRRDLKSDRKFRQMMDYQERTRKGK